MLLWLVWIFVAPLVVGAIARAIIPGRQKIGIGTTFVIGLIGSFVGGFLGSLIGSGSIFRLRRAGFIGSIIGAVIVLAVYLASTRGADSPKKMESAG